VDRLRQSDGRNLSRRPSARLDSSRRRLLRAGIGLAGIVVTGGARILAQPKFHQYPFSLGVASGDPASDGMLWRTDLRIVNDVSISTSGGRSLASFHVEDGRPGAQR